MPIMPSRALRAPLAAVCAAAAVLALPSAAPAATLTGVDTATRLVRFSSVAPSTVTRTPITGLAAGEKVLGIDRRPADGRLYLLGSTSRIYVVDPVMGAATAVGPGPFSPGVFGTGFGWDFNPVVDRIRLTSNYAQDLRLQPDTGGVAATDRSLVYAAGDPNAGTVPTVAGSAYTNAVKGATATQLLDIDTAKDVLALQDPPNDGVLKTVGALGAGDVTNPVGFDIGADGIAYASLKIKRRAGTALYRVDVGTGRATRIGRIGTASAPVTLAGLTVTG